MLSEIDTGLRKTVVILGESRKEELTVCSVKSGINDFLDYISLATTLIGPLIIGPFFLICVSPLYLCREPQNLTERPTLLFILGLVTSFLTTYALHMLVSEVFISDSFIFLIVKNIFGFLFLITVPLHIIITQEDIRRGLGPVFGSSVVCPTASSSNRHNADTGSEYSPCQL